MTKQNISRIIYASFWVHRICVYWFHNILMSCLIYCMYWVHLSVGLGVWGMFVCVCVFVCVYISVFWFVCVSIGACFYVIPLLLFKWDSPLTSVTMVHYGDLYFIETCKGINVRQVIWEFVIWKKQFINTGDKYTF